MIYRFIQYTGIYNIRLRGLAIYILKAMSAQENIDRLQLLINVEVNTALKLAYLNQQTEWVKKLT